MGRYRWDDFRRVRESTPRQPPPRADEGLAHDLTRMFLNPRHAPARIRNLITPVGTPPDATIVNIALPHIQVALKFSTTDLTWGVSAYTLTLGGLLLFGARAGDILGRRRMFITGILLFTFASLLGGLAQEPWQLLAARALHGVGGATASPTSPALITTTFPEGPERNRAFGVFAAVSAGGGAIGLLAGGMLTDWLDRRWVLFVNVPIGMLIAALTPLYISESERHPGRFDITGALASTVGVASLV